jgi:hypothetical protein
MARIGDDGVEVDLEARRQLDLLQVAADGIGAPSLLRDELRFDRAVLWNDDNFSRLPVGAAAG